MAPRCRLALLPADGCGMLCGKRQSSSGGLDQQRVSLSISISIYLSIYLSIYGRIYLSIYLPL
jgi:hypothetical protein